MNITRTIKLALRFPDRVISFFFEETINCQPDGKSLGLCVTKTEIMGCFSCDIRWVLLLGIIIVSCIYLGRKKLPPSVAIVVFV